jgi:hypothetical protein
LAPQPVQSGALLLKSFGPDPIIWSTWQSRRAAAIRSIKAVTRAERNRRISTPAGWGEKGTSGVTQNRSMGGILWQVLLNSLNRCTSRGCASPRTPFISSPYSSRVGGFESFRVSGLVRATRSNRLSAAALAAVWRPRFISGVIIHPKMEQKRADAPRNHFGSGLAPIII